MCPLAHGCTRCTIRIHDPVFHITPLCIRCKPILAGDWAVIGRMKVLGNGVSIYRIETQQLLYACIHSSYLTCLVNTSVKTPVKRRCLHYRACMVTAYTRVVWTFQILSQRTYSVCPDVLVRPSWLLFWEPRAAKSLRHFSFLRGSA